MNIFGAIKKSINSDLTKPLDITLNEIQETINRKATRKVKVITGIPHNTTYNAQVITTTDEPVFSINGSGRILQILPICGQSSTSRYGTVLLSVDGEILLNNQVQYSYSASDTTGYVIVNDTYYPSSNFSTYTTAFGTSTSYYFGYSSILQEDSSTFTKSYKAIISPVGIPFKNNFNLKLTQTAFSDTTKAGVVIVYELYD